MARQRKKSLARRLFGGWMLAVLLILIGGGAGAYWYLNQPGGDATLEYRTRKITRGNVESTVSASGTLRALNTVDVGTQVSGQIAEIKADFNTQVSKGQVIAVIDDATFRQQLREAEASLEIAKATVVQNQARYSALAADVRAAEATYRQSLADFTRKARLIESRNISRADFEKSRAELQGNKARVEAAKARMAEQGAQLRIARAQVDQREASLAQRKLDLERTIIRSPVDGVVISRAINVGQTVAASLQAPILFKIAEDLRKMQVEVSVDEADIGRIEEGQSVEFTVDTFPGQRFPGKVQQVRKEPVVNSNVVTYTVVVSAENQDLRLLPGMTANVTFFIDRRQNVLKVSNAALRYKPREATPTGRPTPEMIARMRKRAAEARQRMVRELGLTKDQQDQIAEFRRGMGQQMRSMFQGGAPPADIGKRIEALRKDFQRRFMSVLTPDQRTKYQAMLAKRRSRNLRPATLYTVGADKQPKRVMVVVGATDGAFTEIVEGPLKAGAEVIIGVVRRAPSRSRLRLGF